MCTCVVPPAAGMQMVCKWYAKDKITFNINFNLKIWKIIKTEQKAIKENQISTNMPSNTTNNNNTEQIASDLIAHHRRIVTFNTFNTDDNDKETNTDDTVPTSKKLSTSTLNNRFHVFQDDEHDENDEQNDVVFDKTTFPYLVPSSIDPLQSNESAVIDFGNVQKSTTDAPSQAADAMVIGTNSPPVAANTRVHRSDSKSVQLGESSELQETELASTNDDGTALTTDGMNLGISLDQYDHELDQFARSIDSRSQTSESRTSQGCTFPSEAHSDCWCPGPIHYDSDDSDDGDDGDGLMEIENDLDMTNAEQNKLTMSQPNMQMQNNMHQNTMHQTSFIKTSFTTTGSIPSETTPLDFSIGNKFHLGQTKEWKKLFEDVKKISMNYAQVDDNNDNNVEMNIEVENFFSQLMFPLTSTSKHNVNGNSSANGIRNALRAEFRDKQRLRHEDANEEEEDLYSDDSSNNSSTKVYYVIENILDSRTNTKTQSLEYLIKWKNYSDKDNTWEPRNKLVDDGLTEDLNAFDLAGDSRDGDGSSSGGGGSKQKSSSDDAGIQEKKSRSKSKSSKPSSSTPFEPAALKMNQSTTKTSETKTLKVKSKKNPKKRIFLSFPKDGQKMIINLDVHITLTQNVINDLEDWPLSNVLSMVKKH